MRPGFHRAAALAVLATVNAVPAAAGPDEAPFGLAWGPVTDVPRPLKAEREANLTGLYYPAGWGPATGSGTAGVVLVVCKEEGLQQVVWVGIPMSGEELARTRRAIHDEGMRRYGVPDQGPAPDSEFWPSSRALLASREAANGLRELVMTAFGPGYSTCSREHRAETGHPAGAHVWDLLGGEKP